MNKPYMNANNISIRESNFELARIVAMLFVLISHSNFLSLGWPTYQDSVSTPWNTVFRLFVQSFSAVSVNLFVLISGWFGIKPTLRKGLHLLSVTLFYSILIFITLSLIKGKDYVTLDSIKNALLLSTGYWFIKSYLFLMILSPALNLLVENVSNKTLGSIIIILFCFQTYFGWTDASFDYHHGFSSLLFIFLYLLARYVKAYWENVRYSKYLYLSVYAILTAIMTIISFASTRVPMIPSSLVRYTFMYLNPIVILSSLSLLLYFSKLHFKSKTINWVASSVLAVYLIHSNDSVLPLFGDYIYAINASHNFSVLHISYIILIVFWGSIFVDKFREILFRLIEKVVKP